MSHLMCYPSPFSAEVWTALPAWSTKKDFSHCCGAGNCGLQKRSSQITLEELRYVQPGTRCQVLLERCHLESPNIEFEFSVGLSESHKVVTYILNRNFREWMICDPWPCWLRVNKAPPLQSAPRRVKYRPSCGPNFKSSLMFRSVKFRILWRFRHPCWMDWWFDLMINKSSRSTCILASQCGLDEN